MFFTQWAECEGQIKYIHVRPQTIQHRKEAMKSKKKSWEKAARHISEPSKYRFSVGVIIQFNWKDPV